MITGLPAAQSGVFAAHGPQSRLGHAGQAAPAALSERLAIDGAGDAEDRQVTQTQAAERGFAPPPPPPRGAGAALAAAFEAQAGAQEEAGAVIKAAEAEKPAPEKDAKDVKPAETPIAKTPEQIADDLEKLAADAEEPTADATRKSAVLTPPAGEAQQSADPSGLSRTLYDDMKSVLAAAAV